MAAWNSKAVRVNVDKVLLLDLTSTKKASFVSDWAYTIDKFDPAVTGFVQSKTAANKYSVKASLENYEKIRFPAPLRISFEDG